MSGAIREDWLAQTQEEIVDPDRTVVDAHHHFFKEQTDLSPHYDWEKLQRDTASHNVSQTVFVQCFQGYREDGPEHLMPVGETEWVAGMAAEAKGADGSSIAAIIGSTDLRLPEAQLGEVLDAHAAASDLFRGIRMIAAWDEDPGLFSMFGVSDTGLYDDEGFRAGVAELTQRGLVLETYQYHHQLPSLTRLARDFGDTQIVLGHLGTPLGVGAYAGHEEETFAEWKGHLAELAMCPNVVVKLGGLLMPWVGFGFEDRDEPATSDEFIERQDRWYHYAIETFGPERCMFESNFPQDKYAVSYAVLWNAFKKIAARYSEAEQDAMLRGTATRVYRLVGENLS